MRRGGFQLAGVLAALFLAVTTLASSAYAHTIGNWEKSGRSWNNAHMTKIKAAMEADGHQVLPDGPITELAFKSLAVFVIAEPSAVPTAAELALLKKFLATGGMILLFGDTGIDLPAYNSLLAGVGSAITFTATTIGTSSALPPNKFTDAPNNVVGSTLSVSSGNGTAGGTLVDNNYVRYEQVGAGLMFVFGDRIDHNDLISSVNSRLLLNIVSVALGPQLQIPTLSTAGLALASMLMLFAGLAVVRRRRTGVAGH